MEAAGTSTQRYMVDKRTQMSLDGWMKGGSTHPDILIIAPVIRDVGEQQLIDQLVDAVYSMNGFHDVKRRHVMSRVFPAKGTPKDYDEFLDRPFEVSEITDEFFGIDDIDLSTWADVNVEDHDTWRYLVSHVVSHPETDFVFRVYTDDVDKACQLGRRICQDTGIALEIVQLSLPTPEQLADEFAKESRGEFRELADDVLGGFVSLQEKGKAMNYNFARSLASYALHLLALSDDKQVALNDAFEHYQQLAATPAHRRSAGF